MGVPDKFFRPKLEINKTESDMAHANLRSARDWRLQGSEISLDQITSISAANRIGQGQGVRGRAAKSGRRQRARLAVLFCSVARLSAEPRRSYRLGSFDGRSARPSIAALHCRLRTCRLELLGTRHFWRPPPPVLFCKMPGIRLRPRFAFERHVSTHMFGVHSTHSCMRTICYWTF